MSTCPSCGGPVPGSVTADTQYKHLLSVAEVALVLGIGEADVQLLITSPGNGIPRALRSFVIAGLVKIKRKDVDHFVDSLGKGDPIVRQRQRIAKAMRIQGGA